MRLNDLPRFLRFSSRCLRAAGRVAAPAWVAVGLSLAAVPAQAQLGLGRGWGGGLAGGVGGLGAGPDLHGLIRRDEDPLVRDVQGTVSDTGAAVHALVRQREDALTDLLQREPRRVERLPDGRVVERGRLLLRAPSQALRAMAQAAGFRVVRDEPLEPLGLNLVVLQAPPGLATLDAQARLKALDGAQDADVEVDPLYLPAGVGDPIAAPAAGVRAASAVSPVTAPGAASAARGARIGLVDGAPDAQHPALRGLALRAFDAAPGCAPGAHPDAHGTAVASLLAGHDGRFHGAAPGAALFAADIYCGDAANGSAEAVLRALAWLAGQQVPVINLSIVGPPNRLLERAVGALVQRGHLLVAAVGNDGPAAPPLYPAAYHGVIGVTGVTPRGRVLPEALQGPQVAFAAPGARVAAAAAGDEGEGGRGRYRAVRGTSFAAPFVAGLLAQRLTRADPAQAADARAALARAAIDLGAPGADPIFGAGWVGRTLRVDPAALGVTAAGPY